jgi:hypothetical protein
MNPFAEKTGGICGVLFYLISTKSKEWEYENEWRLTCYPKNNYFSIPETMICPKKDAVERKIVYSKDCISKVIIGQKFFNPENIDTNSYRKQNNLHIYKITDANSLRLLHHIFKYHNKHLFMSGAYVNNKQCLSRTTQQVTLEQLTCRTFKVNFLSSA